MYDIIIPGWNLSDVTIKCLKSIKKHTKDYRIIYVDNGSEKKEFDKINEELKTHNHLLVRNYENYGFIKAVNTGMSLVEKPYFVLLNNDTEVTPNWAELLRKPLEESNLVLASGPCTGSPGSWQGREYQRPGHQVLKHGKMIAFFCTMFKKKTIELVGLLDERFGDGFGDDDDYCKRINLAGFYIAFAHEAFVHHHHRTSFKKRFGEEKIKEMQTKNLQKFRDKYK
jgi:GT2 family glycosyltransferase